MLQKSFDEIALPVTAWQMGWEDGQQTEPFASAEAAWFWCIETSEALHSGARLRAGMGRVSRPCEPVDIQTVVLRLARQALLSPSHLRTLSIYGQRQLRPDPATSPREAQLWQQALGRMAPILQHKGIIR